MALNAASINIAETTAFVVKNTFIEGEVIDCNPLRRNRSSSSPPAMRSRTDSFTECIETIEVKNPFALKSTTLDVQPGSDCSTQSEASIDISTAVSASIEDIASMTNLTDIADVGDFLDTTDVAAALLEQSLCVLRPDAPPWLPSEGTRLNSGAQLWKPQEEMAEKFQGQIEAVVEAARASVAICPHVRHADATMYQGCCCIRLSLSADKGRVLGFVKEALLKSAAESKSVYVLGYRAQPFVDTPEGFVATLCGMHNEEQACWDMFASGVCCRGGCCPLQHPVRLTSVNVIAVVE